MEKYNDYSKEDLVEMFEELDRPLRSHGEIAVRLCELLSCKHCPVVIHNYDKRTEEDKCLGHAPCAGELHKWITSEFGK